MTATPEQKRDYPILSGIALTGFGGPPRVDEALAKAIRAEAGALLKEREELREEVECDGGSKLARIRELEAALRENDQNCVEVEAKLAEAQREIERLEAELFDAASTLKNREASRER
jgi:predicted RNase H-like nuclease (RuvC/YqgF family)